MDDLRNKARSLINQYGDGAGEVAKARSLRFRALGDVAEAILWERVMDMAVEILASNPDTGGPIPTAKRGVSEATPAIPN